MADREDGAIASRLAELDGELATVRAELVELADADELDDAQTARFDELETRVGELTAEREPVARRAETIARAREAMRTGRGVERIGNGPAVQTRTDPFGDLDAVASRSLSVGDVQSRALSAVERIPAHLASDAQRERAERLIRESDEHGRISRHMLLTGSADYARAFTGVLGGLQPWQLDQDAQRALSIADGHRRAFNEGTDAQGGFLVPFHLDPTIMLTNAGSSNPFRQISRTETIATNAWHGVTSAGVTAGYRGEGTEATDDTPTDLAQPDVPVVACDAYLEATFEATQDTNIASQVAMLLADAKDNFEAVEMAVGDGAAGHMQGVITGAAAVAGSVVTTSALGAFAVGDVYEIHDDLGDRDLAGASWVAHKKIQSLIRQFATGTGQNTGAFWATLGQGLPPELLGESIRKASGMASTVASGNEILAFGNYRRGYLIVDRIGMSVQYNPLVVGANGRPTGKVGWFAHWRTGAKVVVPSALRVLTVQ